ncbi:hypothetical protein AMEX_G24724, partial [Astyanax mexicanus]
LAGLVVCFDVIGYSGGSIIVYCNYQHNQGSGAFFCKESTNQCVYLKSDQRQNSLDHKGRVSLQDFNEYLLVTYRDLGLEDAGSYKCGKTEVWSHTMNLTVDEDPCCLGPKTVIGYLGETITISCPYPEEFQTNIKFFYKLQGQYLDALITTRDTQKGRFSISDYRRSRVVSVRIRDVREDDGGVYYCGGWIEAVEVSYLLLYTEIHLQVSAVVIIIIVSVSICVSLLLIGGLTLIFYKLRCCRTGGTVHTCSLYVDDGFRFRCKGVISVIQ